MRVGDIDLRDVDVRVAAPTGSSSCRRKASCSRARCATTCESGRPEATDAEVEDALAALGLFERFAAFPDGLDTEVRERGSRLSAGERQLVSLARAALADPTVLVLDEATSNLDPGTEQSVEQALERLMHGRTVVVVAHRLSTAARADRIGVVFDGRLAELGSHDELVALGGHYADALPRPGRSTRPLRTSPDARWITVGAMVASPVVYDPYDYAIDANPHPVWKRLRDEAPVYYNEQHDFYALSRFDDVLQAHLDPATFSSAHTTVLEIMTHDTDEFMQQLMIFMDPPQHTRYRKLVSRAFTPRHISALEPRVRSLAARFLDEFVDADEFDYVADFGARLPVMVISALLGAPEEDEDQLRQWTDEMLHVDPGDLMGAHSRDLQRSLRRYWQAQIDERRRRPRDDIMSELMTTPAARRATARRASSPTTSCTRSTTCSRVPGTRPSPASSAGRRRASTSSPTSARKLAEDPSLIPNAVEEILRWEAPSPIQGRWTMQAVELHDTVIPRDSKVALLTGAANRDERMFENPDAIDVQRNINRHVAFGYGIHFCLGAALARLEGRIALEETLKRFPTWTVDYDRCEMVHTSTVRGYAKVPISPR